MLLSTDLHVAVLIVVLMQRRRGAFIPEPEVDAIDVRLQSFCEERNVGRHIWEEERIFETKAVILFAYVRAPLGNGRFDVARM